MSLETMTKLATSTVGVGGSASIVFSNIPQDYTDLVVRLSTRTNNANAAEALTLTINGTNGTSRYLFNGAGTIGSATDTVIFGGNSTGAGATASIFSSSEVYISNYSGNMYKTIRVEYASENNNNTNVTQLLNAAFWSNPSPINSLTFTPYSASTLQQHSTATLYGIKNAAKTAGNSIKATGGNIVFDGTYVTHTFNTSGSFTPTQSIYADYLVVAGGGGGGALTGGGGGAGGLRSTVPSTGGGGTLESALSLNSGTSYTVTIGAGGIGALGAGNGGTNGTNGSDSAFSTITSTGGGFGGSNNAGFGGTSSVGAPGGSGGGAAARPVASGAGTTNQGFAGGDEGSDSGGGGGGAGAVGGNASGGTGGTGGAGVANSITGSSVTYAGGGGGGGSHVGSGSNSSGGAGGGGAGFANNTVGGSGTANTGSGGGGSGFTGSATANGGPGGSGIVIIRYKG
jgi:hypothetical protein